MKTLAGNFLGNITLTKDELRMSSDELAYLLFHEAAHSRQLCYECFDRRRFSKEGRKNLELEATLQSALDMAAMGYEVKDFLRWELNKYLADKYDVGVDDFVKLLNKMVAMSKRKGVH